MLLGAPEGIAPPGQGAPDLAAFRPTSEQSLTRRVAIGGVDAASRCASRCDRSPRSIQPCALLPVLSRRNIEAVVFSVTEGLAGILILVPLG